MHLIAPYARSVPSGLCGNAPGQHQEFHSRVVCMWQGWLAHSGDDTVMVRRWLLRFSGSCRTSLWTGFMERKHAKPACRLMFWPS
eukprot:1538516-Rhodomonas_salina.6